MQYPQYYFLKILRNLLEVPLDLISQCLNQQDTAAKPPITLYKMISVDRDTIILDTSLTIQKEYKFNYLRKDNFELLPFNNVGQTYNTLSRDIKK